MTGQKTENTKIHTVFLSAGLPVGFGAYRKYHPDIKVMGNQEILERVKEECKDVEFVGKKSEDVAEKIEVLKIPFEKVGDFLLSLPEDTKLDLRVPGILWILERRGLVPWCAVP